MTKPARGPVFYLGQVGRSACGDLLGVLISAAHSWKQAGEVDFSVAAWQDTILGGKNVVYILLGRRYPPQEVIIDPISSIAAGYAADKLVDLAESAVRVHVIERWSRSRAKQFFTAFCEAMLDLGVSEQELSQKLNELLADETRSEIVFDAYRSVCLTKAKLIGPRVIALLTAELVITDSIACRGEELIFAAAEELSDIELEKFSDFALSHRVKAENGTDPDITLSPEGAITVQWAQEILDSNWMSNGDRHLGPLDLARDIGSWAAKLNRLGLMSDDLTERWWRYEEDSEFHIDQPGTARQVTWWLTLDKEALKLAALIRRAQPIAHAT